MPFAFRPGTCDQNVFHDVVERNEYLLPESFSIDDVIVDIGAHIGSFSLACLNRNAGLVRSYEADFENFRLACTHLSDHSDRVSMNHAAVWRSDMKSTCLRFSGYKDAGFEMNTGGGDVIFQSTDSDQTISSVPTIPLDIILIDHAKVRLVKLDCEGSEWPILFTSKELWRVTAICGEYHEFGTARNSQPIPEVAKVNGYDRYSEDELIAFLSKSFSQVTARRHGDSSLGLFWASK